MEKVKRINPSVRVYWGIIVLALAFVSMGCGGKHGKVTGTVKYRGTPLTTGTVTFTDPSKQIVGSASIKDGSYAMERIPLGSVKVAVSTPPPLQVDPRHPAPADMPGSAPVAVVPIPPLYGDAERSGLTFEVKSGTQEYPIDLR